MNSSGELWTKVAPHSQMKIFSVLLPERFGLYLALHLRHPLKEFSRVLSTLGLIRDNSKSFSESKKRLSYGVGYVNGEWGARWLPDDSPLY